MAAITPYANIIAQTGTGIGTASALSQAGVDETFSASIPCQQPCKLIRVRDSAFGSGNFKKGQSSLLRVGHLSATKAAGGPKQKRDLSAICQLQASPAADAITVDGAVRSTDFVSLATELDDAAPLAIMDKALELFGDDIAIAFSGAEDVALVEYAHLTGRPFRVFSLDTGRLNPETYRLFAEVEKRYGIHIEYTFPDATEVEDLVRTKGLFSFYEDGHQECCRVRKVRPLRKHLKKLRAWITGQRKDQSPGTRAEVPVVQVDPAFEGLDGGPGSLVKWNPLSNQKSGDVWGFLHLMDVPVNALHSQGYISIGCEPCTRAVLPGQHEREGRWWWEDATAKECGLHKGNLEQSSSDGEGGNGASATSSAKNDVIADLFESGGNVQSLSREYMEVLLDPKRQRTESTLAVLYAPWCRFCQALEPAYVELAEKLSGASIKVAKFQADGNEKSFAQGALGLETFPTIILFPKNSSTFIKYPSEKRDVDSLLLFINSISGTK